VWFNRHAESVTAKLPAGDWIVDFVSNDGEQLLVEAGSISLPPRSVVALIRGQMPGNDPKEVPPDKGPEPAREPEGVPPSGPPEQAPPPREAPPASPPQEMPPPKTS